mmetsp:Transcript_25186/g.24119  ORF Transcript_25186/g.24119 Transcript_25186/m.24119 type:complete len:90 (+) Transcript_25186:1003-1272(+)
MEVYKYYDVLSVNFPQALHIKNKCKTKRKRAAQIVSLHRSASAEPDQKKDINKTKMKIGDSDPDDYVTLVDMIVELWKVQDSATLEANT